MLSNVVWVDGRGQVRGSGSLGKRELLEMEAVTLPEGEAMYILPADAAAGWNGQVDDLVDRVSLVVVGARCSYVRTTKAKPGIHEYVDGWACRALEPDMMRELIAVTSRQ